MRAIRGLFSSTRSCPSRLLALGGSPAAPPPGPGRLSPQQAVRACGLPFELALGRSVAIALRQTGTLHPRAISEGAFVKARYWLSAFAVFTVVAPSALASAADMPIPARTHLLKLFPNSAPRTARLLARPLPKGSTFVIPSIGGPSDPTLHGGSLLFFKIGVPGDWTHLDLPASRWRALGNPAGSKGFKYVGGGSIGDPCRAIHITPKRIKATCRTFRATDRELYLLPVAPSPGVGWEMTVGSDRYCAESSTATGADFRKNDSFRMKATRAVAPAGCPIVSSPTPTPVPTPTPTPTPVYGSASSAFVVRSLGLVGGRFRSGR